MAATRDFGRLLRPGEVARILGCSEWWVKEQARRRRIPFVKVGGAYRFTPEHLSEIVAIFEERPAQQPLSTSTDARHPPVRSRSTVSVVQLRARRPRRVRAAA